MPSNPVVNRISPTSPPHRGSRKRCLDLTDGPKATVASRLTALVAPHACVDPDRHFWMPKGHKQPAEAKLGESALFLDAAHGEKLTNWWLSVRRGANKPNWDIVSQATIDGKEGLVLVEAKAHSREWGTGKCEATNEENRQRIALAINEANAGLNSILPGWNLSCESRYQLANRFAWSWKIAMLGVPVVLAYVGFMWAQEMSDCGKPLTTATDWEYLVQKYSAGVVPLDAWQKMMAVPSDGHATPLRALIRAV